MFPKTVPPKGKLSSVYMEFGCSPGLRGKGLRFGVQLHTPRPQKSFKKVQGLPSCPLWAIRPLGYLNLPLIGS